jgi:hypothetical protein
MEQQKQFKTMKTGYLYIFLLIATMIAIISCNSDREGNIPADVVNIPNTAEGNSDLSVLPKFEFKAKEHDFGKVIQGEVVSYSFKFKNVGKSPLIISNISASCGCTATSYPEEPIMPGGEDFIKVTFTSDGRSGYQFKTVSIAANTQPSTSTLSIKAEIIIPERSF